MNEIMKLAADRGCHGVWLATEGYNAPARGLYQSLQGREIKDIVVYDWGDYCDP